MAFFCPVRLIKNIKDRLIRDATSAKPAIRVNLQFFAEEGPGGERTEKATPRKKQKAREKGQVLQSREISSAVVLLIAFVSIKLLGGYMFKEAGAFFRLCVGDLAINFDVESINEQMRLAGLVLTQIVKITGPVFAIVLVVGITASFAQVGALFTLEPLKPKFSKLNPVNGIKRIFSLRGLTELIKSILKIVIIGVVAWNSIRAEENNIVKLMDQDLASAAVYISSTAIDVAIKICAMMIIIAVLDYGYQWWQYEKDLRMTKHEVKEEYREREGSPEVRQRIRQRQREMSMRRMLTEVPKADVIITNPTHYAVAIQYDAEKAPAPIVTAKGIDYMALRIKEIAKENGVETVENKPLAQALYKSVDIGQQIPPELYQAVAEILAFVYRIKGKVPAGAYS
ncbi:MAG TPA: flagellar biosynthesis protein FlhB [Ruminiclostridium sp.]|jgi:flagellar biosynthetic protein FlhB|nr:flagellar biosynthesis protein FlhB [Clostridiaceae bacterium]HAA25024.1 flagellar biosynthesis protein FlhB [Ruminiclostridium sp.]